MPPRGVRSGNAIRDWLYEGGRFVNSEFFEIAVQAVSTLGVAGGLAYAGLQLRGWRDAQYVANFTKLVELQLQLRKMLVDDPTLALQGLGMPPDTPPKDIRADYYNLMQLSLFEIAWFTHLHSQLTDDYFNSWVDSMAEVVQRPAFREMWRREQLKIMHSGFRDYMNKVMKENADITEGSGSV